MCIRLAVMGLMEFMQCNMRSWRREARASMCFDREEKVFREEFECSHLQKGSLSEKG